MALLQANRFRRGACTQPLAPAGSLPGRARPFEIDVIQVDSCTGQVISDQAFEIQGAGSLENWISSGGLASFLDNYRSWMAPQANPDGGRDPRCPDPSDPCNGGAVGPCAPPQSASGSAPIGRTATPSGSGPTGGASTLPARASDVKNLLSRDAQAAYDSLGSKLNDVDRATGLTLEQTLQKIAATGVDDPFASATGQDVGSVLSQIVDEIANPGLIHQDDRNTCGATTAEYLMAKDHPAEFAQIAGNFAAGKTATFASGDTIDRNPTSVAPDNSNRSDIDRMIQSAFMDVGSQSGGYDDTSDSFANGDQGLTGQQVSQLASDVEGSSFQTAQTMDGTMPSDVVDQIAAATNSGHAVPVGLNWAGAGGHELLVTKVAGDTVYLRNPWGSEENGLAYGPDRQVLDGSGDIAMSRGEFQSLLLECSLPSAA